MSVKYSNEQIEAMDTAEGHQRLIRLQWQELAAFAWRQYLSHGRGAVVIDLRRAAEDQSAKVPTYYLAEGSQKLVARGGWPDEEVAEVIQEYDPEQDVIFLFVRVNGEVFHYNVTDERTPPMA